MSEQAHEAGLPAAADRYDPEVFYAALVAHGLGPWVEMPLWIPESDPAMAGFMTEDLSKALAAGLTFRPLEDTVRGTLDWDATRPKDAPRAAGLAPEREKELLAHRAS